MYLSPQHANELILSTVIAYFLLGKGEHAIVYNSLKVNIYIAEIIGKELRKETKK